MFKYIKSNSEFGRDNPKWLYEDVDQFDSEYEWEEIDSKLVKDSDGFYTDYTMYFNSETGEYVFVFGDKDLYRPEDGNWDWAVENEDEAWEWFNDYTGFEDDEEDI